MTHLGHKLLRRCYINIFYDIRRKKLPKKLSLIVVRVNKLGQLCNSKCCFLCLSILKAFNIDKIYYSNENGSITVERVKNMKSNVISASMTQYIKHNPCNNIISIRERMGAPI